MFGVEIDQLHLPEFQGPLADLFHSKQYITDTSGSGNNWYDHHQLLVSQVNHCNLSVLFLIRTWPSIAGWISLWRTRDGFQGKVSWNNPISLVTKKAIIRTDSFLKNFWSLLVDVIRAHGHEVYGPQYADLILEKIRGEVWNLTFSCHFSALKMFVFSVGYMSSRFLPF